VAERPHRAGVVRESYLWVDRLVGRGALGEIVGFLLAAVVVGGGWYYSLGALRRIDALKASRGITAAQYIGLALFSFGAISGIVEELRKVRTRRATKQVAEEIDKITRQAGGAGSVAGVSVATVAAALTTRVSPDHLTRLVEQQKEKLLIDEDYFRNEVGNLIVDYLQPLPRNAKRLLNRFRVNLLIAHRRGLFTSDPRVTTEQIGKWLVLSERWPQLARSLAAAPDAIGQLEAQAARPLPPTAEPPAAASGQGGAHRRARKPRPDPFTESIKVLAPFYAGDADLRNFIHSKPPLADVLERLAHYGAGTLPHP
jgi:hypothetical protein